MGISGLLPVLSPITRPRHIREYAGMRAGIDGHVWLHRSIFANARSFAIGKGVDNHVKYFTKRCQFLLDNSVEPILVFDGATLPAKKPTNVSRIFGRTISMGRAIGLHDSGNTQAAYLEFAKAAEIKHQMITDVVESLKTIGVSAYVAPYETDAQLTHLMNLGLIDFAISEDSDLLVYGCSRVLFKLDQRTGYGMEVVAPVSTVPALSKLSENGFILACVLAGCDYGPNIRGIGIRKSISISERCSTFDSLEQLAHRAVESLVSRNVHVLNPLVLENQIRDSLWVFKHQAVFDPTLGIMQHLHPIDPALIGNSQTSLVGSLHESQYAQDIYYNRVNPEAPKQQATYRLAACESNVIKTFQY